MVDVAERAVALSFVQMPEKNHCSSIHVAHPAAQKKKRNGPFREVSSNSRHLDSESSEREAGGGVQSMCRLYNGLYM